jgi:hypothetical protein
MAQDLPEEISLLDVEDESEDDDDSCGSDDDEDCEVNSFCEKERTSKSVSSSQKGVRKRAKIEPPFSDLPGFQRDAQIFNSTTQECSSMDTQLVGV